MRKQPPRRFPRAWESSAVRCSPCWAPGDRIVSVKDTYGGTKPSVYGIFAAVRRWMSPYAIRRIPQPSKPRWPGAAMCYTWRTPTNPTIKILDLERLSAAGKAAGAVVIVDNTFATPINQNPLLLGADLVLHSATKYLGGHADALGGVVAGSSELVRKIFGFREIAGATPAPHGGLSAAARHENPAAAYRTGRMPAPWPLPVFWTSIRASNRCFIRGWKSHPGHDIACKQMRGFGGMLSFMVKGNTYADACRCLERMQLARRAANLGSVETIAGPPATTSHVECTAAERAAMGIPESLIRYSVGIEDPADLIADLDQSLS